jgi:opacity protein-like surface antigen
MARGRVQIGESGHDNFGYVLYVTNGFDRSGLDGIHKRNIGDNNENKTIGGRLSFDSSLGAADVRIGVSFLWGKYDDLNRLGFWGIEADVELVLGDVSLYVEVFHRPFEIEATVAENPMVIVGDVARLSGFKIRPSLNVTDRLRLFAQLDALRLRQPRLTNGSFSVFDLGDTTFTIWAYVLGAEYALSDHVSTTLEFGLFDLKSGLGDDISYLAVTMHFSF